MSVRIHLLKNSKFVIYFWSALYIALLYLVLNFVRKRYILLEEGKRGKKTVTFPCFTVVCVFFKIYGGFFFSSYGVRCQQLSCWNL